MNFSMNGPLVHKGWSYFPHLRITRSYILLRWFNVFWSLWW